MIIKTGDIDIIDFLESNFPFYKKWKHIYIKENFNKIVNIFGEDGFFEKYNGDFVYFPDSRWTYYFDTVFFKSEDDLIEFKLRFL